MRRAWLAPVLVVLGIVLQLTVLNGLRLPGGGVPDLVLILVAALAMTEGPLSGLVIGFAAGLCLDLAPPGSQLIGQYALIFCLAGWAAGRLSGPAGRSALRSVLLVGVVVAAAEVLTAAAGLVLEPAQVTLAEIREVLPATIGYDLVLCPFVLYLVVVLSMLVTDGLAGGTLGGLLAAPTRSQRLADSRSQRLRKPRFAHSAAGGPHGAPGSRQQNPARRDKRLRPANGIAGSASGLARHPGRPAAPPVSLRLGAGRRRDGAIASAVGAGQRGYRQPGRHPGALAGARREFRPRAGELGGSATRPHRVAPPGRSAPAIRFGTARRGGTAGRRQGSAWLTRPSRAGTGPRLRMGASRSAVTGGHPGSAVPRLQFSRPAAAVARRPASAPRFRRRSLLHPRSPSASLVSGGAINASALHATRRLRGTPRLRLSRRRRRTAMLGGSGASALRRPAIRIGKRPRFGYGRRSVLSFLTGRRIGGRWLARQRAGSRSGVWLIGKRTGGLR
ncbi:MAG TPA: rod shape-determining protein MreD [Streptosporangiaceae bacterium]|nr:rod shape-determining protein MreD [Streptosporangiaceae bacterium]